MLFGIDVGGTCTDGALYENGQLLFTSKHPTCPNDLKSSLLAVLKDLLSASPAKGKPLHRLVISTTLVTNLLAAGQGNRTALILLPGHSLPQDAYRIAPDQFFLNGMVDFRGKEAEPIPPKDLETLLVWLKNGGFSHAAIAGKFSSRNPVQELQVERFLAEHLPDCHLTLSHRISARLNFPRRAVTAYYTETVREKWENFVQELQNALDSLHLTCDIEILKADGGTMPLKTMSDFPCETIFSGPAASVMGALALHPQSGNAVVIDVGGTTCDLALIVGGQPLYASRGAAIAGHPTQIDAFAVHSLALGGDSRITAEDGAVFVQPVRRGPAVCFGGTDVTLTDTMNVLHGLQLANSAASRQAVEQAAEQAGLSPEELCRQAETQAVGKLTGEIRRMFRQWETEPAYKVWEVVHRQPFRVETLIGIGAGADLLLPQTAEALGIPFVRSAFAPVANAMGAAVVRPTLRVSLHADTAAGTCTVSPPTQTGKLENPRRVQLADMKEMAASHLRELAIAEGLSPEAVRDLHFYLEEQFNVISGWGETDGRIFDVGVEIRTGFIDEFTGVNA